MSLSPRSKDFIPIHDHKELYEAASGGDLKKVISIMESCNCSAMYKDKNGNSALHHAAMRGHLNIVRYLTTIDAVNPASPSQDSMTPLHFSAMYGHLDVVAFLINEQNVDPWCYNDEKQTPLFMACGYGHLEVAEYLIQALRIYMKLEDIVYDRDRKGATVLHIACMKNQLNIVMWLIQTLCCDPNTPGWLNLSLIHI